MKQLSVDLAGLGILTARLLNQRQPWFGDDRCLGRVEHGAFGDGDDGMVAREALFAHLPHGHGGQRHGAVQQRLQRRGHAIAVQREAEQQQITLQDLIQDVPHVVVMDACAAVALAGKAASAVFDMFVDHINDMDILRSLPGMRG